MCRFGLPGEIISDNGKEFRDDPFKTWCEKLNITQRFASVKHPQSNGLVEQANRSLGEGIKARLRKDNKYWVEELPHVVRAHRTMTKSKNRNTLFLLTYGTEAVIPVEIGIPSLRCSMVNKVKNDEGLLITVDLLEEKRELAAIAEEKHKRKMEKYYNSKVQNSILKPRDLVHSSNEASRKEDTGRLGPKYEVVEALGDEAYKLWTRKGRHFQGHVISSTSKVASYKLKDDYMPSYVNDPSNLQLKEYFRKEGIHFDPNQVYAGKNKLFSIKLHHGGKFTPPPQCVVLWNGVELFQVNGGRQNQVVVNLSNRSCTCRKWKVSGIPYKHAVACMFNMNDNGVKSMQFGLLLVYHINKTPYP
nr:reverse transcriptase domain-containing protein [Tanacetum cinerariifolium]